MMLSDVRDYIASLGLADKVYMGRLPDKETRSVGVYGSKHAHAYQTALGGPAAQSYGIRYVTLLVHWNKSPRETEQAAKALFDALCQSREVQIHQKKIKFIRPLYELQDVGTDDKGVYEMVIESAIIYEKGE